MAVLDPVVGLPADLLLLAAAKLVHERIVGASPSVVIASGEPWRFGTLRVKAEAADELKCPNEEGAFDLNWCTAAAWWA